jgi:mRNA-degrading endonuclease RelE of RelBE toxin-antitoxin system
MCCGALEMYELEFTQGAIDDLRFLKKHEQQQVITGIESQLLYEPAVETRNRKRLSPNKVSEWELRLGKFRVFYDVESAVRIVKVEAVGYKDGNQLFIRGEPYQL